MPSAIHKPTRDAGFVDLFESSNLSTSVVEDPESLYGEYREIGHGNFGSVYYAIEKSTGDVVAVKKMSIASTNSLKDSKQKYEDVCREIRMLRHMAHHPNLLAFRRAHCDIKQGVILLITEYCLGSCADVLETLHVEEREIAAIVTQCLAGLAYMHGSGAIHRDVKASNILIGERGVVKLADFGSASSKSTANSFVGTPFWIAPEVILAMDTGQYDARADVWSLGVTCHELVDGRPPYFSLNPMSALYQIAHNEPPQLAARRKPQRDARRGGLLRTTHQEDRQHFDADSSSASNGNELVAGSESDSVDSESTEVFSDAFCDFVACCLQKDVAKRPRSDWLLANHQFVVRDEARAARVTLELLERTRLALSVGDPLKHRRIRENFNAESAASVSSGRAAYGYENVFAPQLGHNVLMEEDGGNPANTGRDRQRTSSATTAIPRSSSASRGFRSHGQPAHQRDLLIEGREENPEAMLNAAITELDAMQLQLRRFSAAAIPVRPDDHLLRPGVLEAIPSRLNVDVDASAGPIEFPASPNASQIDASVASPGDLQTARRRPMAFEGSTGDAKFATLKTKNMLRRELEESQKYVSIREKFAALKRLRTMQQKEIYALEARCETEMHDLRTRLARAQDDTKRDAHKEIIKIEERCRAETEKRERDASAVWKRATNALQKLRKRTLNAASGAKFGSLTKAKAANLSAIETVSNAETRLKAIERLNLIAKHKFSLQSCAEIRGRRELGLSDEQRLVQAHTEEIENAQVTRIDTVYHAKLAHLGRLFELERENHAAFFRSELEKLVRSHERLAKELAKSRKLAEATCKRDTESTTKTVDKDLRLERSRIEGDSSLSKSDRESAIRTAKERSERRRNDEVNALRRRLEAEQSAATTQFENLCKTETRVLNERARDELVLLSRGQQVAKSNLTAERDAELENARQKAATNQREVDAKCAADRDALRARCDAEAAALRDTQRAALREFDVRALADLTTQHCALLSTGASQYSSSANLQQNGSSQQSVSSAAAAFCERLYAAHVEALMPRDLDALSATELHDMVLRELDRFCSADHTATPPQLQANNRPPPAAQPPIKDMYGSSETSSSIDTSSVTSCTLERPSVAPAVAAAPPVQQPTSAVNLRVKKMSLGAAQQPPAVFVQQSALGSRSQADAANGANVNVNVGVNVGVRLRNEDPQHLRVADSRMKAKRNSMVVLSSGSGLGADRDYVPYDYNGAIPRGMVNIGTPPKTVTPTQMPSSTSSSQLSNYAGSGASAGQAQGQGQSNRPAVWPPSMASHLYAQTQHAAPGVPYGPPPSAGSAGRHAGIELQQQAAAMNGNLNGSRNSGSPGSSVSSGSRQIIVSQAHRRRLFGLFGSSHNVNDSQAALAQTPPPTQGQTQAPSSDSIPVNLNVNMNVPRNRYSMNINYSGANNWSLSNAAPRSHESNENSQM